MATIRRYLVTGLIVWLPILVTILVIHFIVELLDQSLNLLPKSYQPAQLFGFNIPGLGVLFSLLILFFTGMAAANFLGNGLVKMGEAIVHKIPLVRTVYTSVQQVLKTLLSSDSKSFRKVLLIEYPRKGIWSIAFLTGDQFRVEQIAEQDDLLTVFVPTTPNPTSGFLLVVPKSEVIELDISIDKALKMVISLGVVRPAVN